MRDIKSILAERQTTHGDFSDNARVAQDLKLIVDAEPANLSDVQREALHMICHKIARILAGDPNYDDVWLDISGYAQLVVDRIKQDEDMLKM